MRVGSAVIALLAACSPEAKRPPVPLSPFTNIVRQLFAAMEKGDSGAARAMVDDSAALASADFLATTRPDLIKEAAQSLAPVMPYRLTADSAYLMYRVANRRRARDLVLVLFVRRRATWRVLHVAQELY